MMSRRRFAFWIGFGLFNLSEWVRAETFDKLAAAAMRSVDSKGGGGQVSQSSDSSLPTHWSASGDDTWRWYERENLIDGQWVSTGITTPINKKSGERKTEHGGYVDEALLPADLRASNESGEGHADREQGEDKLSTAAQASSGPLAVPEPHLPTAECKGRHGRPPSKWLRSLYADEIRIWLKSIKVPEADVSGMTFWEHLT
ncbi:MAG TPA: hypothetical protein VGM76_10540, partial [Lacipirellulaceae bacterium]